MRLSKLSFRGLTRFVAPEPVVLDLEALGPGLVAVVGANGAGKSTAFGATPAALWKFLPDRPGSLYEYAHGRDAFVEAAFREGAREIRVRLMLDAEARRVEGYVVDDGVAVADGKAASFDAAILERFGTSELFLASVFASQGKSGNFLAARPGERKELFAQLLGLGRLEVLAGAARGRAGKLEVDIAVARKSAEVAEAQAAALPAARQALGSALEAAADSAVQLREAGRHVSDALVRVESARAASGRLVDARAAAAAAARERATAEAEVDIADRAGQAEADRIAARRREIEARDPDGIEARARATHADDIAALDARRVHGADDRARAEHVRAFWSIDKRLSETNDVLRRSGEVGDLEARLAAIRAREAERRAADDTLRDAVSAYRTAEGRQTLARLALSNASSARLDLLSRLAKASELLGRVPCVTCDVHAVVEPLSEAVPIADACPLLAEARSARARHAVLLAEADPLSVERVAVEAIEAELVRLAEQGRAARTAVAAFGDTSEDPAPLERALAALRADLSRAQAVLEGLGRERQAADDALARALEHAAALEAADRDARHASANRLQAEVLRAAEVRAVMRADLAALDAEYVRVAEAAGERSRAAREALRLARERQAAADERVGDLEAELGANEAVLANAYADALRDEERWTREHNDAVRALARHEATVEALQARARDAAQARDEADRMLVAAMDWSFLADSLGKNGLQALEIDAAAPEVARLVNDLLESCYGPRFSVALETLRAKKSGDGAVESLDVRVYDGAQARPAEALSGGERVILSEAIGLGLAIYNARKSGVRWETLWRDETAGALDPEHAQRYVAMLRRARDLGGFWQVLYVAHQPEVSEAADARVVLEDGRARIAGAEAAA